jgi:hypothetical protein
MELPTLNVTEENAESIYKAFGSKEVYERWLKAAVRDELRRRIGWDQINEIVEEIVPDEPPAYEQPE